jgi:hypothetical protein
MKIQVFKQNGEMVVRVSLTGAEVDRFLALAISAHGPGLARYATPENCRPLFETADRTYEIRLPESIADAGAPPPRHD